MSIKVLLVDDHKILREGLISLLERSDDIVVVAQAENGVEALLQYQAYKPDVVVMDMTMPVMSGIEATRKLLEESPNARVLAFSMVFDQSCVAECLKAGAKGYLLKDCAGGELITAIRTIHSGKSYLCTAITDLVINELNQKDEPKSKQLLSSRELEVLKLIADGENTKQIAFLLEVSNKTVETIRINLMKKVGVFSIAELTKYAIREGITTA
jgi:DNA-binding NarL/FixJ family response regulator